MKKFLTNNIGLKLLSVLCAVILWVIVVNVDDPIITRVYSGIPVDVINGNSITAQGKTYEVDDDSDTISVAISANRSVIERLTKESIKATADLKNLTLMNTVPIEVRTTRYSEKIDSITSRTTNLSLIIEDRLDKQIKLSISTEGSVASGYIPGDIVPVVDVLKVSGPESKIKNIDRVEIVVDYAGMNESFTMSCPVTIYDVKGQVVDDPAIVVSKPEIRTSVEILEAKEIPVTAYYVGTAAAGFGATGTVICDPSSIVVAGKGTAFDTLSSVKIPDEILSIDGAFENATSVVNIKDYLPKGVVLADSLFDGNITILAVIEPHDTMVVDLPVNHISVVNLPEGYTAHVVSGEDTIPIEVSGLADDIAQIAQAPITAQIDAQAFTPRVPEGEELDENTPIYVGSNDGNVLLNLPSGVAQISTVNLEVVINHVGTDE